MLQLLHFKLLSTLIIFVDAFLGGLIAVKLASKVQNADEFLSKSNCLSAGILLGAAFIHLLPESQSYGVDDTYPISNLCGACGFLAVYFIQQIFFSHKQPKKHVIEMHSTTQVNLQSDQHNPSPTTVKLETLDDLLQEEGYIPEHSSPRRLQKKLRSSYILLAVLSLESILSGSALGMASKYMSALVVFIAIVTHIWAGAFALCTSLLKSALPDTQIYKLLTIFCSMTPIGILCGITLHQGLQGKVVGDLTAVLMSFAAGTFLYVGIIEMLHEELSKRDVMDKFIKIGLVITGTAFMAVIPLFV